MKLDSIGMHIREIRLQRKLTQEQLAEKVEISPNYLGAIERGEKVPALETLLSILNALNAPSNIILKDVVNADYPIKTTVISDKIDSLPKRDKEILYALIETYINNCK